jgi:hypothetical protein
MCGIYADGLTGLCIFERGERSETAARRVLQRLFDVFDRPGDVQPVAGAEQERC